jgi:hypothetical protein
MELLFAPSAPLWLKNLENHLGSLYTGKVRQRGLNCQKIDFLELGYIPDFSQKSGMCLLANLRNRSKKREYSHLAPKHSY